MNVYYIQTSVGQPSVKTPWGNMNVNVQKATRIIQLRRTVKVGLYPLCPHFPFLLSSLIFPFYIPSSMSPSGVFINLHIIYYNISQLFVLSEVQSGYITCSLYSCNDLLPAIKRVLQYTPVSCCMPYNFLSSWELSCPTVERTFCPSSQTS